MSTTDITIDQFFEQTKVIPLPFAANTENLLLQAATLANPRAGAELVPARFDEAFFRESGHDPQEWNDLIAAKKTSGIPPVKAVVLTTEKHYANAGAQAAAAAPVAKAGGGIEQAQEGTSLYLFTNLQQVGVDESLRLHAFFENHMYSFCTLTPYFARLCNKEPSIFRGHTVDVKIAFVVRYLAGKRFASTSTSSQLAGRLEGGNSVVGADANVGVEHGCSSQVDQEGAFGAYFMLMHVVSDTAEPDKVQIRDHLYLPSREMDKELRRFFRNANFKLARKVLGGSSRVERSSASPEGRVVMAETYHSQDHPNLDAHRSAVAQSAAAVSLGVGGWEEEGLMDVAVELHEDDRLTTDGHSMYDFTSSKHVMIRNSVTELSRMYAKWKRAEEMTVNGSKVLSMSPAFFVDTRELLPIHCYKDGPDVPGRVIREHLDATLIYPVQGFEDSRKCASVGDVEEDPWEVRESIVRIPQSDTSERNRLLGMGFSQLADTEDHFCHEGHIAMARHVLVRESDFFSDDDGPFGGDLVAEEDGKPSAPAVASMPSLVSSRGSPQRPQKRTKM